MSDNTNEPTECYCNKVVAEFVAQREEYVSVLKQCVEADDDYHRWQGHAEARRQLRDKLAAVAASPAEPTPEQVEAASAPGVPVEKVRDALHSSPSGALTFEETTAAYKGLRKRLNDLLPKEPTS